MSINAYTPIVPISASATVAVATDSVILATAATVPVVVTLFDPNGRYGYTVEVINDAASKNIVVVAAGTGSIVGGVTLYPGQSAVFQGDGIATFYNFAPTPPVGRVSTSLSSVNILALNATPISLIPSPGAGKIIKVLGITLKMVTTATGYANGGALEFRYTNASGAKVSADIAAAVVTAGAATSYTSVAGVTTSLTNVADAAIVVDNATAAFITGTGTGVVTCDYAVVTP